MGINEFVIEIFLINENSLVFRCIKVDRGIVVENILYISRCGRKNVYFFIEYGIY